MERIEHLRNLLDPDTSRIRDGGASSPPAPPAPPAGRTPMALAATAILVCGVAVVLSTVCRGRRPTVARDDDDDDTLFQPL